jgi:hypothetical protein
VKEITYTDEDDEGDSHMKEEQLNSRLVLLQAIVDGIKEAGEVLQEDYLFQKEKELRAELAENDPYKSVHLATKEEIREFEAIWMHHLDILQIQVYRRRTDVCSIV